MRAELAAFTVPAFVRAAIDRVLQEAWPPGRRPLVTSHNDVNPSNLAFDGERLLLLDWDMAGPHDPFHDLATAAMFLSRSDGVRVDRRPRRRAAGPAARRVRPRATVRRFVAALCATIFLHLAQRAGHPGGDLPADPAPTLLDVYGLMSTGELAPNTAQGAWSFALALVRTITDQVARSPAAGA